MLDWKEILKVQVLDTTTGLSTINEPMVEDDNCCEKMKNEALGIIRKNKQRLNMRTITLIEQMFDSEETTCDEIIEWFELTLKYNFKPGEEFSAYIHGHISENDIKQVINNYYKCSFGGERYVV